MSITGLPIREKLRRLQFQPPRRQPILLTLDEQHRTVSVDDLPATITLEAGHLSIRGQDSKDILESLKLLVAALERDFEGVVSYLDPAEEREEAESRNGRAADRVETDEREERE